MLGDFNLTLDVDMDRLNTYCNNNLAKQKVQDRMEEFYLKDVWRIQNPDRREYSWIKEGNLRKASRIDFALVSAGLDQNIKSCTYLNRIKSDHRGLYMCIENNHFERGTGYWKLNTQMLQHKEYVDEVTQEIHLVLDSTSRKNPSERWELIKTRIKKISQSYTRKKTAEDKIVIGNLAEKLNDYESRLPLTQEEDEIMENTKLDYEEKILERAKGIIFRSKVKWHEEGEKKH